MVKVIKIYPTGFSCNSYLVTANDRTAILIDAGQPGVMEDVMDEGLKVTHVLLTHGHFDHVGGCLSVQHAGAQIGCHKLETDVITDYNLSEEFGTAFKMFKPNFTFEEGEMEIEGIRVKILHTPGHTKGSVCFVIENNLFTGDTLFCGNIGRTDFATGDQAALEKSIKRLYKLPGDYTVYAGHDRETTLEWERKHNFYVRED